MLKGMAIHEINYWYQQVQATAPPFVFEQFMQLAQSALSENKFQILQAELGMAEIA